jgi:hypothetical protein
MSSLAFEALDRHVIGGRADDLAVAGAARPVTYARLLELSAALGGGLRLLGVEPGTSVDLRVEPGLDRVVAVLAVVRLHLEVAEGGDPRLGGTEPLRVHLGADEYEWDTVLKAGAGNPAGAAERDPEGYADRMRAQFGHLLDPLLGGGTVTL